MRIESPLETRRVEDYDIESITGNSMTFTIDVEAGDTIEFGDKTITIFMAPRSSKSDSTQKSWPETTTVNKDHVFAVRKRERDVLKLTPKQEEAVTLWNLEPTGKLH